MPADLRDSPEAKLLAAEADDRVCNIVQLIYESKAYEGVSKDYEFSRRTTNEHWRVGYEDTLRTLSHGEALIPPDRHVGVRTFDLAHADSKVASLPTPKPTTKTRKATA